MSSTIFNLFFFGSDPINQEQVSLTAISIFEKNKEHSQRMSALTGNYLSSQAVSNQVLSTYKGLTAVFGMGTGGTP